VITGAVHIDLTAADYSSQLARTDRHLLDVLNRVPDGARVVVDIGNRKFVTQDAAAWLHEHDHRLSIEIHGTHPEAVAAFIHAGRTGDWGLIA
jgi:hypothetical protein